MNNYRKFGSIDWNVSSLGFSLARLPIDNEAECIDLIHGAIDKGINYIDVGMPYDIARHLHLCGILAKALHSDYRQKMKISLTLPVSRIHSMADFDLCLNEQLQWLAVDTIDFCALGRITRDNWPHLESFDVFSAMDRALLSGKVGYFGFSYHDHFQILKKIIAAYDKWRFCQFQYSYMDIDHDPGTSGIRYAGECGLAVVVTEALKSGRLINNVPDAVTHEWDVAHTWETSPGGTTLSEWALRFVLSLPEVSTVVSAMNTKEQIAANMGVAEAALPDGLSVMDELLLARVRDAYRKTREIPCPSCRPCMPCPMGIDVPRIFEIYNDAIMYHDAATARSIYRQEGHDAGICNECGICAGRCAKRLEIPELLKKVRELLP
jgi:uncharacterized protein